MAGVLRRAGSITMVLVIALLGAGSAEAARPNVIAIVTDDQTLGAFSRETMPRTYRRLVDRGTTFEQAIVATPQCCPSRAGFLTGQYPQNNKVISNRPGYPLLKRKRDVLPRWLQAVGYRTIHIGKYLNGYALTRGGRPAPGWDRWRSLLRDSYTEPWWSIDGRLREDEDRYLTETINRMAEREIGAAAKRRRPFYLQIDHLAPHVQPLRNRTGRCRDAAVPAPQDASLYAGAEFPDNPATTEADVSDKPEFVRRLPPADAEQRAKLDRFWGCALASLRSVDRGVEGIVQALAAAGELGRTMIVFTSDNGFSFGEHRMALTKGLPYEEHLRVPLVVRPPAGFPRASRRGLRSRAPVANIDLAPTILRLARAEPCRPSGRCRRIDGRSLLSLLRGRRPSWSRGRAIGASFDLNAPNRSLSCRWAALRLRRSIYVEHSSLPAPGSERCRPERATEYYDLRADPFQLDGALGAPRGFARRLDRLQRCSGIRGRDHPLRGRPFCE